MQRDQLFQVVRPLRAICGLAPGKGIPGRIMGMADVIGRQGDERPTVVDQTARRDAAEADAVIALLAADDPGPLPLAARAVIGHRHL